MPKMLWVSWENQFYEDYSFLIFHFLYQIHFENDLCVNFVHQLFQNEFGAKTIEAFNLFTLLDFNMQHIHFKSR